MFRFVPRFAAVLLLIVAGALAPAADKERPRKPDDGHSKKPDSRAHDKARPILALGEGDFNYSG